MKRTSKRLTALMLTICMLTSILPMQIWAEEANRNPQLLRQGEQPTGLDTPEGEIPAEEDWDQEYPYGTFAFGTYQADVAEPGALSGDGAPIPQTALLPVYRVGGTTGRATVRISYAPAVTTDEGGTEMVYDYAASGKGDLFIEAENPNPLAAYQQIGLPEAERNMLPAPGVSLHAVADGANSLVLRLQGAEEASGFRWQYQSPGGFWKDVEGASEPSLELTWEDYSVLGITGWEDLDFRCILTVEDHLLCTVSLNGAAFTTRPEVSPVPEDLELPEEPGYTVVEFENDYDMYAFDLTFADGETVKYIRVTALDDAVPELPELGLFTIIGCEGGALSDLCNTLTLMVSDNDEGEPSALGFTVSTVTVDRASGVAEATIRRTGGTSYSVGIDYETVDGTAKAGTDYAAKHGTLAFAGSIDEITVPIELISTEETGEKTFSLKLSNLKGGGTAELCTLETDLLTFTLTGISPKGETRQNLASVLSRHDGSSAAERVTVADEALIPEAQAQHNHVSMAQEDPVEAAFVRPSQSATRSHTVYPSFQFTRGNSYSDAYWHDWEIINGNGVFASDVSNSVDYSGLWSYGVYSGKNASEETYVRNDPKGGVDKNGNPTYVLMQTRTGTGLMEKYLEISSNYKGGASFQLPGAGKLFDETQFIAYLDGVGTKSKSSNSRYSQPLIQMACTPYGSDINAYASGYAKPFYVKNNSDMQHWMYSGPAAPNAPTFWNLADPREDYGTEWPDSAFLDSFPMRWDSDLYLNVSFAIYKQWNMTALDDFEKMQDSDQWTIVDIPVFRAQRRVLTKTNSIPVVIYTANDADEAGTSWTPLPNHSEVYQNLKPNLSLVSGAGGVTGSGQLYYGSAFTVDISGLLASYSIPDDGLFVTNSAGEHVGTIQRLGATQWRVTMDWDGATEAALTDTYQINILLERSQTIEIDLHPSIGDNQTEAFDSFTGKTATVKGSVLGYDAATKQYFGKTETYTLHGDDYDGGTDAVYYTAKYNNIQSINFHQDPEDVILYNGKAYAGNATIQITAADLTHSVLHFEYHGKNYLDQISTMRVNIDHVELYYDKNGDGIISGTFKDDTFYLAKDADGETTVDELITTRLSGDYPESTFKPVVTQETDENGNVIKTTTHQYYLKVFYTLRPRAYRVPQGASAEDTAQILPALASAVTDETAFAALTPEQQSYRYLSGANTDGHKMYTEAALVMSYVDIPLGGDAGSVLYESVTTAVKDKNGKITGAETKEVYTWTPAFVGNLLVPFDQPTPVTDTGNITGHPVPMAGKDVPYNSQTKRFTYDSDSLAAMNAYLGAMTGRSTFVLGVQQQTKALDAIESLSEIKPETITMGTVATTPSGDSVMSLASGGDAGGTDGSTPGDDVGYPEFGADLGTELPSLELELGDYATLIIDGYQVGFAIGIPIYTYEDTNYSGSEKNETLDDGSHRETKKDENGNTIVTETSKDGKTVKTATYAPDPSNPDNVRTVTTQTVVTDDKGNKTYKTVVEEQENLGEKVGWMSNGKTTTDTNPPAPSQDKKAGEQFKDGFKEANGQMQTLADFVSACKSRNLDKMKDFMSGAWEDDSLKNAKNGNCTSTKVEVSFTVQISIMFEYNPIDNCHYFKSAGLSASLGIELSAQHRFSFFPLAYVYVKLGIEVEAAVSLSCIRNPKLGPSVKTFRQGSLSGLSSGQSVVFDLNMKKTNGVEIRGFHIDLLGTVYMEIFDNPGLNGRPIDAGALSGDGSEKEVLLEAYGKTVYIRLTPLRGQVVADHLRPVTGAGSKVVFDGLNITPSISLEAGVGIGVELLKFELFVKTSIAITMTMGGYLEDTDKYEGFYISDFNWGLCLGFNITALFFNYTMEAIGISVQGSQKGTGGYFSWDIKASAVDGNYELWSKQSYTAANGTSLGTEEPEELTTPNDSNFNIGPKDPGCTFYSNGAAVTLNQDGEFPDDCGWELKENMTAYGWDGGAFKGETPMDKDIVKVTKDGGCVTLQIPANTGKILIYFDGKLDVRGYGISETGSSSFTPKLGVKKSPVEFNVGNAAAVVYLYPDKGTWIDRWAMEKPKEEDGNGAAVPNRTQLRSGGGLIHVSGPTDVSATQNVTVAGQDDTRSVHPTGTTDFELSGYNTACDAKKLVSGLANGYSYKLFQADGENYILYPLMLEGTAQLVLSRIVVTGNLSENSGLAHPTDSTAAEPWIKVDNDSFGDLDFNVSVDGKTVTVVWTAYTDSTGGSAVERAKAVEIKRAALTLGTDAAFSDPMVLSKADGSYQFLPAQTGTTSVWAQSMGTGQENNRALASYLIAANPGLTQEMLEQRTTDNALLASAVYRWVLQSDLNAIYGDGSVLTASTGASAWIPGEFIENIELGNVNGRTLAFYSTTQAAYFDAAASTPVTVSPEDFDANTELATIRRLYLRELKGIAWSDALLLETVIDFDGCTDDNLETRALQDGIYTSGSLQTAQADPYFGNLRFLTADLDGSGSAEKLLLFEMGGNSYLLRQADLLALLSNGQAAIVPIFEQTTGTDVSIGSDGENLAVVYTAAVPGSLSNAIYSAWWDRRIGTWGSPTILAMRHLQVYEDGIKYDMEPKALEQAYLGKLSTPAENTGSMYRLHFSDLQMSTRSVTKDDGSEGRQLLVLTNGSMQKLREYTLTTSGGDAMTTVAPDGSAELSFYAIAFGVGEQALGQGKLRFGEYDFTAGKRLVGGLSFTNTGTAAIRGSDDNPITVRMLVQNGSESQELAKWKLSSSIPSGGTVDLSFYAQELAKTLPDGASFRVEVTEDPDEYGANAFRAVLPDLFTVEAKPELSLTDFSVELNHVEGDTAYLSLQAAVSNNGSADANGVYLQFAYDTGERDASGLAVYKPVDITGSSFVTSAPQTRVAQPVSQDYKNGVYQLKDASNTGNLNRGFYRTVTGTLAVPTSCFVSLEEFSGLHLRAELYSDFDSPDYNAGLYSSDHNEYNGTNNRAEQIVKHQTFFTVPARISTALGTTLTLPVSFESTSANPELILTEISDGSEGWEPRMGVCYYDPDRQVIVAAPNSTAQQLLEANVVPTGILQIKDSSTNSIVAITYKVGAMADGVNIYKDDASFTFHDANGELTELNAAAASNPGWIFLDKGVDLGWTGGETAEIPMNNDLSLCNQDGAYFTFETVADTLTFYFMGELRVESSVFGTAGTTQPFTTSPVVIDFGNGAGLRHTVTVTGKAGTCIDRYVATYETNPVVDGDPNAPQILWNRNYPQTASLLPGDAVPMTCYIVDGTGIRSVVFNGQTLTETTEPALVKLDEGLWYFDYSFTKNGVYPLRATDLSDNSAKGTVGVDWFNDVLSSGAIASAPGLTRPQLSFVDASGNAVPATGTLTTAPFLKSTYGLQSTEQSAAYLFSDGAFAADPLGKAADERWLANWNGYYQVRIDRADGTWARAITLLTNLDETPPGVTPDLPGNGTPDLPYLIGSREDWKKMQTYVNAGNPCVGMCFRQTANFAITDQDMVGTNSSRFKGVYDGGAYTLTFNAANAPADCAPFQYAENASFRNLLVQGSVTTSQKFTAGILADAYGICSFCNCRVSITIQSKVNGDGTHGGLVSYTDPASTVNITGCTVDGSFLGESTSLCGGFVGYCRGVLAIRDSIFAPAAWQWTSSQNFYRWQGSAERTVTNSYYLTPSANNQGSRGYAVTPDTDVALTRTGGTAYDVAGLYALSAGVFYNDALRAAEGEVVSVLPYYIGSDPEHAENFFLASSGTLTENDAGGCSLTMPASDVVIRLGRHDWGEAIYTWSEDNSSVTARRVCSHNAAHFEVETASTTTEVTTAATCLGAGKTTYTAVFTNPAFETQTRTVPDIPPLGHDLIHHDAQAPACTEIGWEAYDTCSRCDYTTYTELAATGHAYKLTGWSWTGCAAAKASFTCANDVSHRLTLDAEITVVRTEPKPEEDGSVVYTATVVFEGQSYTDSKMELLPAIGHDYVLSGWTWEGYTKASASFVDRNGGDPIIVEAAILVERTEPDCETTGQAIYTATVTLGNQSYSDRKTELLDALGHDWGEARYAWAEDYSSVTATAVCRREKAHVLTETVTSTYIITKPSTYKKEGIGTYRAEFQSDVFSAQTVQIVIPSIRCDGGETCPSAHFKDIPGAGHWTHLPIDWAVVNKLTAGTSKTTFSPKDDCTRAQFATFLWQTMGSPEPEPANSPFADVKPNRYYYKAILWAYQNGITAGTSETTFSPNEPCTRAQIVTFLWRMEGSVEPAITDTPFTDLKPSAYYWKPILWAYENGITAGTSATTFRPGRSCSRAEAVTFLYREFAK